MLFNELGLPEEIVRAVAEIGYEEATEIQAKTIPLLLEGKDVVGRSQTGTGKTAAFGLPAIAAIDKERPRSVQALILCPTRELAMQACEELCKFAKYLPYVKPVAIYGGADIERQITQLKKGANIIVGTPGRVMDHIRRHTLHLDLLRTIILDEADEMLNMGFREDIEEILQYIPEERQTVLFSATMPPQIMAITSEYQREPVVVGVQQKSRTVESVAQFYYEVPMGRKTDALCMLLLAFEPRLSMIFCNTKHMVDELSEELISKGFKAAGLHGDMKQQSRTQVLNAFRSGRIGILIATDVAARGIDVDDVDAVFNYDIPQDNEYYIHRIGRTGRAGKSGCAYTIVSGRRQIMELKDIARFTKADIVRCEMPTRDDVIAKKTERVIDKVKEYIESGKYSDGAAQLEKLLEGGYTAEQVAATLLGMRISKETRSVPEFIKPVFRPKDERGGRGKSVKMEISLGRQNRIAPNFVLGALVDATGMAGKCFGKIDIYDRFTTVEIPEADKEHILDSMTGTKINGQKIKVKLYEGKGADYSGEKDYRSLNKKRDGGRGRYDGGRNRGSDSRSKSGNRRRRYQ
ncbi:MAG: DEAD/DEAH box helicase [Oscillospiraceae bacterium]|nr:DEAD/DEAH box helicase [Oscillospiraceae bacterium]